MRPALVAPDSFKGSFSAAEVAAHVARGLRAGGREAIELPVADGGEGTMEVLLEALGGDLLLVAAHDPLGRPLRACIGLLPNGTAVVETAAASGLELVAEDERDAWAASTRGTGELIAAAVDAGANTVIVAVGGSATTDGGAGALAADVAIAERALRELAELDPPDDKKADFDRPGGRRRLQRTDGRGGPARQAGRRRLRARRLSV